jgi:hypothetical protein
VFVSLLDARRSAATFLCGNAALLDGQAADALLRAAGIYKKDEPWLDTGRFTEDNCFQGPWTGKSIKDWTEEVRRREIELLAEAQRCDAAAIAEIAKALTAIGSRV